MLPVNIQPKTLFQEILCKPKFLQALGGHSERDPPVPIPNTEVKPLSPNGTARVSVWESRASMIGISQGLNRSNKEQAPFSLA